MYIGVPKGYPFQPPVFVLALDRKSNQFIYYYYRFCST